MTVFQAAADATFAAFGIDADTPAGGEPVSCRETDREPAVLDAPIRGCSRSYRAFLPFSSSW